MAKAYPAYAFTLPAVVLVLLMLLYPLIHAVYLSVHDLTLWRPTANYVGLQNYARMLSDRAFWRSLDRTLIYVIVSRLILLCAALGLAVLMNEKFRGRGLVRALLITPMVVSGIAVGIVWQWLFASELGVLNHLLSLVGIGAVRWLGDATMAMVSVIIASVWMGIPFGILILLGALQGVSAELHEAAQIDGANNWIRFYHITLPTLKPTIAVLMIYQTMAGINHFESVVALTGGGPIDATRILALYMYETAFSAHRMSYGSTIALFLLLLNLIMLGGYSVLMKKD